MSALSDKAKGILLSLSKKGSATAVALGTSSTYLKGLVDLKLVKVTGTVPTGARPRNVYALTAKGSKACAKLAA